MFRKLLWLGFWIGTTAAAGQSFYVERSAPASGAVGVPLEAEIHFYFNDAVSQQTDFNTAFLFTPQRAVRLRRVDLIPETPGRTNCPSVGAGQVCPNLVIYTVGHQPETDYTWLVFAVRNARGRAMSAPYVLRYTTAATMGPLRVSGTVEVGMAKRAGLTEMQARTLRLLLDQATTTGLGRPVFEADVSASQTESDFTVVFLLRHFSQTVTAWDVAAATAFAGKTGAYRVDYVRPGTYWPVAVRYRNLAQLEIEALGYYDANGDGEPDSVTLQDAALTDVTLQLYPFTLATARERLSVARNLATALAADAQLIGMMATNSPRRSGHAYSWTYEFFSLSQMQRFQVRVDPLGAVLASYPGEELTHLTPVPEPFIDSDRALTYLLEHGMQRLADSIRKDPAFGLIFDPNTPLRNLVVQLVGGEYYTDREPSSDSSYWQARLTVFTATQTRTYEGWVNMTTGQVRVLTTKATASIGDGLGLSVYPNPFEQYATFRIHLPQAGPVRLMVYDVLGREVVRLYPEVWLSAGIHEITWRPHALSTGLYIAVLQYGPVQKTCRLQYAGQMMSRRF